MISTYVISRKLSCLSNQGRYRELCLSDALIASALCREDPTELFLLSYFFTCSISQINIEIHNLGKTLIMLVKRWKNITVMEKGIIFCKVSLFW